MHPSMNSIPYQLLNRHGRRSEIAIERKRPQQDRIWNARREFKKLSDARAAGLAMRIAKVKQRKAERIRAAEAFTKTLKKN